MPLAARWSARPYSFERACAIADALGLSLATASVLARRGYGTPDAAARFLAADERHDPSLLAGPDACETILHHRGGRIVVHGDYDVDGVCATAVLVRGLRRLGAEPRWHLPVRSQGYGLSLDTVARLASERTELLITVDCGIGAVAEVDAARRAGMDVVVTDHHLPRDQLPDCPLVHPALAGYPCAELCGTAVAHKLVATLYATAGLDPALADEDLDLVGLATVADVVALRGENRRLVRDGLETLRRTSKAGLRALMGVSGCDSGSVDEHAIGFRLAPRLNAAGRLQRADAALELILCDDGRRAAEIAQELDVLNRERQDTETRILFAAEAARSEHPDTAAYVLAGEGWHPGVIGIVAGRLVERYHRPCVVIGLDADGGRGSGRSIAAYDLHAGLAASAHTLRRFGGHRAAAGLEIEAERVADFREALCRHAATVLTPDDLVPVERVDAAVSARDVGLPLAEELDRLRPFGHGNPKPTLLVPAVRVKDLRPMGDDGQHVRCRLVGATGQARAVAFRTPPHALAGAVDQRNDVVVSLELNEWRGAVEPRLVLRGLCAGRAGEVAMVGDEPFWDAFRAELARPFDAPAAPATPAPPPRMVRDRRDGGIAGAVADLVSSGEPVLVVCADAGRRRPALADVVAGVTAHGSRARPLALAEWETLARDPTLARPFAHLVALDPPASADERTAAEHAPCDGAGFLHLAWGPGDAAFARSLAAARRDLRAELRAMYRALRAAGDCAGETLLALLRGDERQPRGARHAARLIRMLGEVELVKVDLGGDEASCTLLAPKPTDLAASPTYRACRARFEEACAYLDGCLELAA